MFKIRIKMDGVKLVDNNIKDIDELDDIMKDVKIKIRGKR
jgi:hypothetical protein